MTETKFRVWDKNTGLMHHSHKINGRLNPLFNWSVVFEDNANNPDLVIMQYTGLKDKNESVIYEGDIVIKHGIPGDANTWDNEKRVVSFQDGSYYPVASCYFDVRLIEVVGNVYENPELLEGKQ